MAKALDDLTLDEVRAMVRQLRDEGLKIQSHYKRLDQEYGDWEDRLNALDQAISQAEIDTGLKREEIIDHKHNELTDELGEVISDDDDEDLMQRILNGDTDVRPND